MKKLILSACLASSQLCLGGPREDVHTLSELYETIVFGRQYRQVVSKYLIRGTDPEGKAPPQTAPTAPSPSAPSPSASLANDDRVLKLLEEKFMTILQRLKQDQSISFDAMKGMFRDCSSYELAVIILATDNLWPAKKAEIRGLVREEIERRGTSTVIAATIENGWLEYRSDRLVYRYCIMYDLFDTPPAN